MKIATGVLRAMHESTQFPSCTRNLISLFPAHNSLKVKMNSLLIKILLLAGKNGRPFLYSQPRAQVGDMSHLFNPVNPPSHQM